MSIHYGDSDDDILAAKEAGIRGIRLMRAANSTYQPMPNPWWLRRRSID